LIECKPREERPYTDFYPDLDVRGNLTITYTPLDGGKERASSSKRAQALKPGPAVATFVEQRRAALTVVHADTEEPESAAPSVRSKRLSTTSLFSSISKLVHNVVDRLNQASASEDEGPSSPNSRKGKPAASEPPFLPYAVRDEGADGSSSAGVLKPKGSLDSLPKPTYQLLPQQPLSAAVPALPKEPFQRPEDFYLRYIEPNEADLDGRVEYDLDEQGLHLHSVASIYWNVRSLLVKYH
jgi:hypothetical protein